MGKQIESISRVNRHKLQIIDILVRKDAYILYYMHVYIHAGIQYIQTIRT